MLSQNSNGTHGESTKDSLIITAFQTACLAILVLLAKFVGDLLYDATITNSFTGQLLFLLLVSSLNFLEIINNWATIKKHFSLYNTPLFLIDVLTLGVFFWQIYILSKLESDSKCTYIDPLNKMLLVVMISYWIIFVLYILWNVVFIRGKGCNLLKAEVRAQYMKEIIHPSIIRFIQVLVSFGSVLVGVDRIPILIFDVFIFAYSLYALYRNGKLDIFSTIIAS